MADFSRPGANAWRQDNDSTPAVRTAEDGASQVGGIPGSQPTTTVVNVEHATGRGQFRGQLTGA